VLIVPRRLAARLFPGQATLTWTAASAYPRKARRDSDVKEHGLAFCLVREAAPCWEGRRIEGGFLGENERLNRVRPG
jgi:hypothetical protein